MLTNVGIQLRALRPDDAVAWHAYLCDPAVIERTSYPIVSLPDVEAMVADCVAGYEDGTSRRYAIARLADDRLIGTAGFSRLDARAGVAELAYDLERASWGHGLMTIVVEEVVRQAFAETGLERIEALTRVDNVASQRVLRKCGFTFERTLPAHRTCRGIPFDFHLFSRLRRPQMQLESEVPSRSGRAE
ncbi:MAG TPA: GNAT family N-acetyltransferase [Thermoanaerobaculia bacterium]|nr:GNAT family N-acetyltransferase [Thermoanaerobaculia bacterium]